MTDTKMQSRQHITYLDNIRTLLIVCVILTHASAIYVASIDYAADAPRMWYYVESRADMFSFAVLALIAVISQAFLPGLFFFIAGYFTPFSCDRKGIGRFLSGRLLRLGTPLLFYAAVLYPIIIYMKLIWGDQMVLTLSQWFSIYRKDYFEGSVMYHIGPLWFLQWLLIFTIGYAFIRRIFYRPAKEKYTYGRKFANAPLVVFALAIGLMTFAVRLKIPAGIFYEYINIQPSYLCQYIPLFIAGVVVYRRRWLGELPLRIVRFWRALAFLWIFVFFPLFFVLGGAASGHIDAYVGGLHWQALVFAVGEQILCIAIIISLLYLFQNRFNIQGRLARQLSRSSYATYILHAPLLLAVALAVKDIEIYPLLKFLLVSGISLPLCFGTGILFKKLPGFRKIF